MSIALLRALAALDERERQWLVDHYWCGLSAYAIAARDGCGHAWVALVVERARNRVVVSLESVGEGVLG